MTPTGLPSLVLVLVLASAMLHAWWNVLLARVPRGHDTTAVGLTLGLIAWAPLALARWRVDDGCGRTYCCQRLWSWRTSPL
jgi:hypothetical protein